MKKYYRVMLGQKSVHASEGFAGNFIGADFEIPQDLTPDLPDDWRVFNKKFIPIFMASHPAKTKIGAGLACGALRTVSKGLLNGDTVLCPDGAGSIPWGKLRAIITMHPTNRYRASYREMAGQYDPACGHNRRA